MLIRTTVVALCLVAGASCGGDDTGGNGPSLRDRVNGVLDAEPEIVVRRLAHFGVNVTVEQLDGAGLSCPDVDHPEAGDRATCRLSFDDAGIEVEVDVEFVASGGDSDALALRVVNVTVAP